MSKRALAGKRAAWGLVLACALIGPVRTAHAGVDEERAAARALAQQGSEAFTAKRFSDAVDLFQRAESLIHSPVHLLYLARANAELGHLVKAQEAYIRINRETLAADAPPAFQKAVEQASAELETLRPRIASATVTITGAGATSPQLFVDEQPVAAVLVGVPIPLDPGTHHFVAKAEGMTDAVAELTMAEGHQGKVELTLTPGPAAPPGAETGTTQPPPAHEPSNTGTIMRYSAYGSFALGAIGLGLGTVFILDSGKKSDDASERFKTCRALAGGCPTSEQSEISAIDDEAASSKGIAVTGFVVGGLGVAAGVTLLLLAPSDDETASTKPQFRPWIGLGSAGVSGTF
jgi:hypothetical protein